MITRKFTATATAVLALSREHAIRLESNVITTTHMMLAILQKGGFQVFDTLSRLDVDMRLLASQLEEVAREESPKKPYSAEDLVMDKDASNIMKLSVLSAMEQKSDSVDSMHFLLAITRKSDSEASRLLACQHVTYDVLRKTISGDANMHLQEDDEDGDEMFEDGMPDEPSSSSREKKATVVDTKRGQNGTPTLDTFGTDLTDAARQGILDPCVGREKEVERVAQILSRRKKNNPILIGEPGVGKSAIVEGLAQRIVERKIARILWDRRVVVLDLGSVVAGTKYRGQFEERIRNIIVELQKNPNIIVFIDEIHTMIGAGNSAGQMDAANLLKPALARGEIQCIGATTLDEYRKTIEKDGALERRFQKVLVEPTSQIDTLNILKNLRTRYEEHHNVQYTDEALEACVKLTERYVADRCFPDKAIDAMDEAGSRTHIQNIPASPMVEALEEEIKQLLNKKNEAVNNQNFELAADFRDQQKAAEARLAIVKREWEQSLEEQPQLVDVDDVASVVSMMTGIPVTRLGQEDHDSLRQLDSKLQQHVVGQDEAIHQVARAIKRSRVGLKDPKKPIGTFMFVGPTGVGKTYLAKRLALELFGSEDALIRIDMSEYMEKHTVSRMVGAPPGYVGYDEGGQLTEKVRRRPYSIVLLDEIEKAHQDVFNILLQVMDDGRLTDGNGATIDFRNTIIIMTSNCGTRQLREFGQGVGFDAHHDAAQDKKLAHGLVEKALKKQFAPEFLNRLDDIIYFDQLDLENIKRIVDIEVAPLVGRVADLGYELQLTEAAKVHLAQKGYDVQYGARPLHRAIQTYLEDNLTDVILNQKLTPGQKLVADVSEGNMVITIKKRRTKTK